MIFDQNKKDQDLKSLINDIVKNHEIGEIDQMIVIIKNHSGKIKIAGHGENILLLGMCQIASHTFLNDTPLDYGEDSDPQ